MGLSSLITGEKLPIVLRLADGSGTKFPRAFVTDSDGSALTGSPVDLVHVADGIYEPAGGAFTMPATDHVNAAYIVFSDAGRTTIDASYDRPLDTWSRAKELEDKIDAVPASDGDAGVVLVGKVVDPDTIKGELRDDEVLKGDVKCP